MFHVNIVANRPFKFGNLVELQILGGMVKEITSRLSCPLVNIDFHSSFFTDMLGVVWYV